MVQIDIMERNRHLQSNKFEYEYSSYVDLDDVSCNYFRVPSSIISGIDIGDKRVSVFSFFSIRRGLDRNLLFSVNNIVKWMKKQPNRNANGINNKIIQTIKNLSDWGYLELFDELNNSSCIEANFNLQKISHECDERKDGFALIYLDELNKILSYQDLNTKDVFFNNDIVLLVFAYLRMKIYRRSNKLLLGEINLDNREDHEYDIKERMLRAPEAYDCYYYEIAEELGLSPRIVSKAVNVLWNLNLIYFEPLPRIKYNDKWRTDHTIFCNTYKREKNYLLASGSDYYMQEIVNKKKKLKIVND